VGVLDWAMYEHEHPGFVTLTLSTAHRPIKSVTSIAQDWLGISLATERRLRPLEERFPDNGGEGPAGASRGLRVGRWRRAYHRDPLVDAISEANGMSCCHQKDLSHLSGRFLGAHQRKDQSSKTR